MEKMKKNKGSMKNCKRIGICLCYDKDGIIDDYILYLLNDMKENSDRLLIVVNGMLTSGGRRKLLNISKDVVVRENKGFDAGGWKYAMTEYLGWETLEAYDELVLFNDTFYGPLYPFRDIFERMADRPVDFWGLTAHGAVMSGIGVYFDTYLQSCFLVIRKRMHGSEEFKQYWENQKEYESPGDVVVHHEVVFTRYFEKKGFQWEALIDTEDLDGNRVMNHSSLNTEELLKRGFPVLKRKPLQETLKLMLAYHNGEDYKKSMQYIQQRYSYDTSLIWQNILRIYNIGRIHDALGLDYVLDSMMPSEERAVQKHRAAVVLHLYYTDKLKRCIPYIRAVPVWMDVIITTVSGKKVQQVKEAFSEILGERMKILKMRNRGRDMAALLVAARPYIVQYEYLCFCHDKMSVQMEYSVGKYFERVLWENTLSSTVYIENIIRCFEKEPYLGLLTVPSQVGGMTPSFSGKFWLNNYQNTLQLLELLDVKVPVSEAEAPLSIGNAFWCRTAALRKLFAKKWDYDDFPQEPMGYDGQISHALERCLPFVAQDAGYYTGIVMTPDYAEVFVNAYKYFAYHPKEDSHTDYLSMTEDNMPEVGVRGAFHLLYLTLRRRFFKRASFTEKDYGQ